MKYATFRYDTIEVGKGLYATINSTISVYFVVLSFITSNQSQERFIYTGMIYVPPPPPPSGLLVFGAHFIAVSINKHFNSPTKLIACSLNYPTQWEMLLH